MKLYIIATFLLIALTVVLAAPIEEDYSSSSDESHNIDDRSVSDVNIGGETPRLCGFPGQLGGIVGDSVCVADCQLTGYRGGHCEGDACYCD